MEGGGRKGKAKDGKMRAEGDWRRVRGGGRWEEGWEVDKRRMRGGGWEEEGGRRRVGGGG